MYDHQVLYTAFVYDLLATLLVFVISFLTRNSTWYDPYWSVAPVPLLLYFTHCSTSVTVTHRQILVAALVLAWSIRLTYNWTVGFLRQSGATAQHSQDWRYIAVEDSFKRFGVGFLYWPVGSLLGIHLLPTVLVFLGCLSVHVAVHGDGGLTIVDVVGGVVTATAIIIETVADEQLRFYIQARPTNTSNAVLQTGLWKHSRHPNYFGEALFWTGLYIIAVGVAPSEWVWLSAGPLSIILLFNVISIPLMEGKQVLKRPGYRKYQQTTSRFIPWFRGH